MARSKPRWGDTQRVATYDPNMLDKVLRWNDNAIAAWQKRTRAEPVGKKGATNNGQ